MQVRAGKENMDPRAPGCLQSSPGAADVRLTSAGQAGDDWAAKFGGNQLYRAKVIFRSNGKARFYHIHAQIIQLARHAEFVIDAHAAAGSLLAIAQRGVKKRNAGNRHGVLPSGKQKIHVGTSATNKSKL